MFRHHIRVGAGALPRRKNGHDCSCSQHAADLQDFHLFPTVKTVGFDNIGEWRYSGKVVQLAFISRVPGRGTERQTPSLRLPLL